MWFSSLVLRNLWNRKVRSFLTAGGMSIAVCAVITLIGVADVFEQAVTNLLESRGVDMVVTKKKSPQRINSTLPQGLRARLEAMSGVRSVDPVLIDVVSFPEENLIAVYILGWEPGGEMYKGLSVISGRKLEPSDDSAVMLGAVLARNLEKQVGDHVEIEGSHMEVVGIYQGETGNEFESSVAILPLATLQRLMSREGLVTSFVIRVDRNGDKKAILARLSEEIPTLLDDKGRNYNAAAQSTRDHIQSNLELRVVKGMAWSTSAIALFIGVIGMLNTMMISVFERTREIGTLRAVGWRRSRVVRMILTEALLLSAAGAVMGLLLSLGLTWFLSQVPSASNLILPSHVTPSLALKALLLAVVSGVLGAIYPAYLATRLQPTEALRHE
jgi:putative ABC transport system permease protein